MVSYLTKYDTYLKKIFSSKICHADFKKTGLDQGKPIFFKISPLKIYFSRKMPNKGRINFKKRDPA